MSLQKAKSMMMNSSDMPVFYDTDTEIDDINELTNGMPFSCEVDVLMPNNAQYKRSGAEMK